MKTRDVVQVGNYDYMYDVRFKLDGEIGVTVKMAGGGFKREENKMSCDWLWKLHALVFRRAKTLEFRY